MQFLHLVPSPTACACCSIVSRSLPIRAHRAARNEAVERSQSLLDALPGGRQALDARMGESQASIREKREHIARAGCVQGGLLPLRPLLRDARDGAVRVLPRASPGFVDLLGGPSRDRLARLTPSTQLPLLSVQPGREPRDGRAARARRRHRPAGMADVTGNADGARPRRLPGVRLPQRSVAAGAGRARRAHATFLLAADKVDLVPCG
jgi:hypothetical protein